MTRAVCYLRVSTDAQAGEDCYGLADQRKHIKDYAAREGIRIIDWLSDEGVSGATLDRPALNRLITMPQDDFELVIVAKLDRLARDLFLQLWIEKELLKRGHRVVSATEAVNGFDPTTTMMRQLVGMFAQFERARIVERMAGGRRRKREAGGYAGGAAPLGYKRVRGQKALAIDPKGAKTVKRCFQLAKAGHSHAQIAAMLNKEGHRTARGTSFSRTQVWRILGKGDYYSTTTAGHKAILNAKDV